MSDVTNSEYKEMILETKLAECLEDSIYTDNIEKIYTDNIKELERLSNELAELNPNNEYVSFTKARIEQLDNPDNLEMDSLVKNSKNVRILVIASEIYTYDFNEFDLAYELASKAVEIDPAYALQNQREICRIRKFLTE